MLQATLLGQDEHPGSKMVRGGVVLALPPMEACLGQMGREHPLTEGHELVAPIETSDMQDIGQLFAWNIQNELLVREQSSKQQCCS